MVKSKGYICMNENLFNPYVRFCKRRCLSSTYPNQVCAYDFRLFYVLNGSFTVQVDDANIKLEPSSILTIPPGTAYKIIIDGAPVEFYVINFDFDSEHTFITERAPVQKEFFSKNEIFSKNCLPGFEQALHFPHSYEFENAFRELGEIEDISSTDATNIRSGLMKYILSKIMYLKISDNKNSTKPQIQAIKEYVNQNFSQQINNKIISKEIGYHPHYLNSYFLHWEGITLHTYIESVRLKHAQKLLITTQNPVYDIAQACGFVETSYFIKFFFRHTGMTPKHYRQLFM